MKQDAMSDSQHKDKKQSEIAQRLDAKDLQTQHDVAATTVSLEKQLTPSQIKQEPKIEFYDDVKEKKSVQEKGPEVTSDSPAQSRKWAKWVIGVIIFVLLIAGVIYGTYYYDLYKRSTDISQLLPADSHIVMQLAINADADQYTHLENQMEKIPGYHILKKNIDDSGTGKTLSQHIRETFQSYNLDYDADIKTVLGDEAIVVLPDIIPLSVKLRDRAPSLPGQIITIDSDRDEPSFFRRFLTTTEAFTIPVNDSNAEIDKGSQPPLEADFIMSAPIIDMAQARNVLKKMETDEQQYTVDRRKSHGVPYVRLQAKVDGQNSLIGIGDMYHTIISGHWIVSNNEQLIIDTLARNRANGWFAFLSSETISSGLVNDETFHGIDSVLKSKNTNNLFSVYININTREFTDALTGGENESFWAEYVKYPERYSAGFAVEVDEKGFILRRVTLDTSVANQDITNTSIKKGLTQKVPSNLNEKFGDLYFEYDNVRDLYYSFKKNGLTPKGVEKLNEMRDSLTQEIGIDYEVDLIDQFAGGMASVVFARSEQAPESAIIMQVNDSQRMRESVQKAIDAFKKDAIEGVELEFEICNRFNESMIDQQGVGSPFSDLPINQSQKCLDPQDRLQAIRDSAVIATQTPSGTVYSYKSPENTDISFDFGFQDSTMIAASNFATVENMFIAMGGSEEKFATDQNFIQAFEGLEQEGFVVQYIKLLGVWNSIQYVFDYFTKPEELSDLSQDALVQQDAEIPTTLDESLNPDMQEFQQEIEKRGQDIRFLIGTYMRVIDTIASVQKAQQGNENITGNTRIQITDLPQEDLERANAILDGF